MARLGPENEYYPTSGVNPNSPYNNIIKQPNGIIPPNNNTLYENKKIVDSFSLNQALDNPFYYQEFTRDIASSEWQAANNQSAINTIYSALDIPPGTKVEDLSPEQLAEIQSGFGISPEQLSDLNQQPSDAADIARLKTRTEMNNQIASMKATTLVEKNKIAIGQDVDKQINKIAQTKFKSNERGGIDAFNTYR